MTAPDTSGSSNGGSGNAGSGSGGAGRMLKRYGPIALVVIVIVGVIAFVGESR